MTPARVWIEWLGANVIPSIVVSALLLVAGKTLGTDVAVVIAYVVLFGLVAVLQARVWRRWRAGRGLTSPTGRRWTLWTIAGLVAAMFFGIGIVVTLDGIGHERLGLFVGWAIAGLVLGSIQAAALGVSVAAKLWWISASVAGWGGAAAAYSEVASTGTRIARVFIVRWLVGGLAVDGNVELAITAITFAVYGALTGLVLARLTPSAHVS